MARSRNIKPGFFSSDQLAECEPLARLLFAGLWTIADRDGHLEDRPKRIKIEVLPYDDCDPENLLTQLAEQGLIVRYAVEGCNLIEIPGFPRHQNPHVNEKPGNLPSQPVQVPYNSGSNPADSLLLIPSSLIPDSLSSDSPILIPSKENHVEQKGSTALSADDVGGVVRHYQSLHPKAKPGEKEKAKILARLKEGYSADDLKAAIDGCHRSPFHCGENPGGKKYQTLDLIMRDSSKVAKFLEEPIGGEQPVLSEKTRRTMRAISAFTDQQESKNGQN